MVILRAGASHDSDPDIPSANAGASPGVMRLPLAGDVFWAGHGQFASRYPACQRLMRRLRAAAPDITRAGAREGAEPFHEFWDRVVKERIRRPAVS